LNCSQRRSERSQQRRILLWTKQWINLGHDRHRGSMRKKARQRVAEGQDIQSDGALAFRIEKCFGAAWKSGFSDFL